MNHPHPAERSGSSIPRFCSRCGEKRRFDRDLCVNCGETASERGYCPVCEAFLLDPPGAICPKHDVELIEFEPAAADRSTEKVAIQWVPVCGFHHPSESVPLRIRLEAEGIPTFIDGERTAHHLPGHGVQGDVKLLVPIEHVQEARVILAQSWRIDLDDDHDDDWDESDEDRLLQEIHPTFSGESAKFLKFVLWILVLLPIVALILKGSFKH
jgi:hypothetical protein